MNMDKYYEYRKEIHKLYNNDTRMNGDLCSRILELRDKNKNIEAIDISLQSHSIAVDLAEDTTAEERTKITEKIANRIGAFIVDNKDAMNIENEKEFDSFLESESYLFCDFSVVGNSIKFSL